MFPARGGRRRRRRPTQVALERIASRRGSWAENSDCSSARSMTSKMSKACPPNGLAGVGPRNGGNSGCSAPGSAEPAMTSSPPSRRRRRPPRRPRRRRLPSPSSSLGAPSSAGSVASDRFRRRRLQGPHRPALRCLVRSISAPFRSPRRPSAPPASWRPETRRPAPRAGRRGDGDGGGGGDARLPRVAPSPGPFGAFLLGVLLVLLGDPHRPPNPSRPAVGGRREVRRDRGGQPRSATVGERDRCGFAAR